MSTYKVAYLVGSISLNSINRKLANALKRLAPAELELVEAPIKDLSLYNHDLDAEYPAEAVALKETLDSADGVIIITPEYNRGVPGGLKNAIDWASRPWGQNSFAGKPSAVIGTSPGGIGSAVAQQQVKTILAFSDSPQMGQPEGYIQFTDGLITDDGRVTNPDTEAFLASWIAAFHGHVADVATRSN